MDQHRYAVVTCAVLARECYQCAAVSRNLIDVTVVEQGLHDMGEKRMSDRLQARIDNIDQDRYDAILLVYGLCNYGTRGLRARVPIVLPRAHDCITLLMGSSERYLSYFKANPGTYFRSAGWTERADSSLTNPHSTTREMGMSTYEEYLEKYGEDNARYLMEVLNDHLRNYTRLAYIDTGVANTDMHREASKEWAREQGWDYHEVDGDTRLISMLMEGDWDESEFLLIPPGKTIRESHDGGIVEAGNQKSP
jgi:hypothetical protein